MVPIVVILMFNESVKSFGNMVESMFDCCVDSNLLVVLIYQSFIVAFLICKSSASGLPEIYFQTIPRVSLRLFLCISVTFAIIVCNLCNLIFKISLNGLLSTIAFWAMLSIFSIYLSNCVKLVGCTTRRWLLLNLAVAVQVVYP